MGRDIKDIKNDQQVNNEKIDGLSDKVNNLEKKSNDSDLSNKQAIEDLKGEMTNMEDRVTTKLLAEIEPSLNGMKCQSQDSVGLDIRRIVQEELALQKLEEKKKETDESGDEVDPENERNKKIKKT